MQDFNDLYYFVKAAESGGFAPAGRAIGVPKSRLSRRVALLEQRLGVRLIHRSTRHFALTEVGQRYLEHCRAMLVEAEAAQQAIDSLAAEPAGTIRMTCPVGLLNFHVGDMLARFMARYPKVSIHLEATNRRVDVLAEGLDLAVRVRPPPLEDSDLALRVLSDRGQCLVASPALLERMGTPAKPEDLRGLPSLNRAVPQEDHAWVLEKDNGESVTIRHSPRYVTTDMLALKSAALAGVGIVQLPILMLSQELQRGALVPVLQDWRPPREVIHVLFPSRRGMLPSMRALIDFLAEGYRMLEED